MRIRATILGALVVGSVVAMDPGGWSPFGPAKWMIVSTLGFAGVATAMWGRARRLDQRTWWLWLGLVGLLTTSALVNHDVRVALLGQSDRHLGVVTWLLFWALFAAGQVLDGDGRHIVTRSMTVAAGVLGAYSTVELVVGRPIAIASTSERLVGPYGSAAFLGAACCLLLPVAIGQALAFPACSWQRAASGCAVALTGVALIGSGARAAWIGVAIAAAVAFVVRDHAAPARADRRGRPSEWIRSIGSSRSARTIAGLGVAVVIVAVVALAPRLGDVVERDHGAASRLDEWAVAVRVIERHPVLGVGPEGYRIASAEGIDAAYERTYGRDRTLPDRAHSSILDVALAGGVLAMLVFIALMGFVSCRSIRLVRSARPTERWLGIGVIAYAVQGLFLFPLAEVDPLFWLAAGMVVTLAPRARVNDTAPRPSRPIAALAGMMAAVSLVAGVLDTAASRLAKQSLSASAPLDAIDAADRAVELRPDSISYRLLAADAHLRRGSLDDVDAAIAEARRALQWAPRDPFALDELGVALLRRAIVTGSTEDGAVALGHWRRLVADDPDRARWQVELGRAAALAGDADDARQAWTTAARLDPDDPTAPALLRGLPADG